MDQMISANVYPFQTNQQRNRKKEQRLDRALELLRTLCNLGIGGAVALLFLTAGAGEVGVVSLGYTVGRVLLSVGLLVIFGLSRKVILRVQRQRRRERLLRKKSAANRSVTVSEPCGKAG